MNNDSSSASVKQVINWSDIHDQMEKSSLTLEENVGFSKESNRAILKKRAQLLARESQQVKKDLEFLEIVEFRLATETYGVESAFVREVFPLKSFTSLPGVPPFVLGIANVHGKILSIIDLKKFFDLPSKGLGQLNKLIILRNEKMEFGILTDEVLGASSIPVNEIQAAPPTISGIGGEYLRGVTNKRVILLDTEKILGDEKIIVDQTNQ